MLIGEDNPQASENKHGLISESPARTDDKFVDAVKKI